ncbi:hypothetical protein Tco_1545883 [Tanacetum coccineum]
MDYLCQNQPPQQSDNHPSQEIPAVDPLEELHKEMEIYFERLKQQREQEALLEAQRKQEIILYPPSSDFEITPVTPIVETTNYLSMGDTHLDTEKDSNKSSVKDPIPIQSESDDISDVEYDLPINDEHSPTFTTFSNPLFDSNDDFTSSDDESLFDEDVPMENSKFF